MSLIKLTTVDRTREQWIQSYSRASALYALLAAAAGITIETAGLASFELLFLIALAGFASMTWFFSKQIFRTGAVEGQ